MALTHHLGPLARSAPGTTSGPVIAFGAALGAALLVFALARLKLHSDLALPLVVLMLFLSAALAAMVARLRGRGDRTGVTYWDVAGALTFVGIAAAALVDPEQLLRIVADPQR